MNYIKFFRQLKLSALALAVLALAAAPSFAAELAAVPAEWTPPGGGTPIAMWGFVDASPSAAAYVCPGAPVAWANGPTLPATAGGPLTVNVKNCLSDPVSIFIPGQLKATTPVTFTDPQLRVRVRSFDAETAPAAVGTYTWSAVKEGTYLYHSGTHPQVQVQMGLYGALVVTGGTYPVVAQDEVLVYSEIDPALHAAVDTGTYGTTGPTSTLDYKPRYFLINGAAYPGTTDIMVDISTDVLLRLVNAGLKTHVPTLEGGLYMSLIAEDGNLYPFPLEQYGVDLPAAKTIDAVINVGTHGRYALYDRALGLTNWLDTGGGMLTYIDTGGCLADTDCDDGVACTDDSCNVGTGSCDNDANDANCPDDGQFCSGDEFCDAALDCSSTGDPCDDGVTCTDDSCNDVTDLCGNVANDANCPDDGQFCNGDEFCDAALDCSSTGDPCPAGQLCDETSNTCNTPPNIAPFANDDFATVVRNSTANIINVTDNDVDADGTINVATVVITSGGTTQAGGTVLQNGDGNVTFTPRRGFRGTDLFTYTVNDNDGSVSNEATVSVNVVRP